MFTISTNHNAPEWTYIKHNVIWFDFKRDTGWNISNSVSSEKPQTPYL